MTLNRQNNIFLFSAIFTIVLLLVAIQLSVHALHNQSQRMMQTEKIVNTIGHFRSLFVHTLLYNKIASPKEWENNRVAFNHLLKSEFYTHAEEKALLEKQLAHLEVVETLYFQLTQHLSVLHPSLMTAKEKDVLGRIVLDALVTTQNMLDAGFDLLRMNRTHLLQLQNRLTILIVLGILVLSGLFVAGYVVMKRRILKPLAIIQKSAYWVTQGNFKHTLSFDMHNEIGDLAHAFNQMLDKLTHAKNTTQLTVQMLSKQSADLAHMQQQLQTMIDAIPALVDFWDKDYRNQFANKTYTEWFGLSPIDMRGKHMKDILGVACFDEVSSYLPAVLAGKPVRFTALVKTLLGERHLVFSYVPYFENDVLHGFYGFISDITQLKQTQLAKENALAELQSILDSASDFAILAGDEKGVITSFSKGAELLLGYKAEEVVGKTDAGLFHVREEIIERGNELSAQYGRKIRGFDAFVELARQGQSESREWTYVRKDRTTVPVNLTVAAIRNEQGRITGYLGIAKDIHQEKEILAALGEARDKAEAANLSKSQFLANMSHEIRTPMNAILGMLQLLHNTEMTKKQLDYVIKTQTAAQSLLRLLNDILDFSKVEANKMTLESISFCLDDLLRDLSVIFSSSVGSKAIEVLFSLDKTLPSHIVGDVVRLRQVLINLVGNAIKFTEKGEVIVSLKVLETKNNASTILFSVKDSGVGIPKEKLEDIFEGFTQAEASTTRRFGGTGLGLAISQRIVQLMGGKLAVTSTENIGSCFYFTLTFHHGTPDPIKLSSQLPSTPYHVLIVDDNEVARELMLNMIATLGWTADAVGTARAALACIQEEEPLNSTYDVILMDWKMPDMDGLTAAQKIRAWYGNDPAPLIIMVTAHDRDMLCQQQLTSQQVLLDGFLVKPMTSSMLVDVINEAKYEVTNKEVRVDKKAGKQLSDIHILVIEDTEINQEVIKELLLYEGATVEIAENGAVGLEKVLSANPAFDLVLTDIQMPVMDGYTVTRKIREHGLTSLPIIAMTANAMASDREACLAAGMNDHVAKPIEIGHVIKTILMHCRPHLSSLDPKVKEDAQSVPVLLPSNEHRFEFEQALARLDDNRTLFTTLAKRFKHDMAQMLDDLTRCVDTQELEKIVALLHTIKGVAATLGASALSYRAAQLESQFKAGNIHLDASFIPHLQEEVSEASLALEKMIATFNQTIDLSEKIVLPNSVTMMSMLDELERFLMNKNMRATHIFSELEEKCEARLKDRLQPLSEAMHRLDFKLALEKSRQLRMELS